MLTGFISVLVSVGGTIVMKRTLWILVLILSTSVPVTAQTIKVVPQDNAGEWTVSFSRRHDPKTFELDSFHKTLVAAKTRAEKLVAWSDSMEADSSWRLAQILIEGEDGNAEDSADEGKATPNRRPGDVLREYMTSITGSYKRARRAKDELMAITGNVRRSQFDSVNRQIKSFNRERGIVREKSKTYFAGAPQIARVSGSDLKGTLTEDNTSGVVDAPFYDPLDFVEIKEAPVPPEDKPNRERKESRREKRVVSEPTLLDMLNGTQWERGRKSIGNYRLIVFDGERLIGYWQQSANGAVTKWWAATVAPQTGSTLSLSGTPGPGSIVVKSETSLTVNAKTFSLRFTRRR